MSDPETHTWSFELLWRMNNFKQVDERNESLLSDVFCEWVKLVLEDIKIITFEYMIEILLNVFQKLQSRISLSSVQQHPITIVNIYVNFQWIISNVW